MLISVGSSSASCRHATRRPHRSLLNKWSRKVINFLSVRFSPGSCPELGGPPWPIPGVNSVIHHVTIHPCFLLDESLPVGHQNKARASLPQRLLAHSTAMDTLTGERKPNSAEHRSGDVIIRGCCCSSAGFVARLVFRRRLGEGDLWTLPALLAGGRSSSTREGFADSATGGGVPSSHTRLVSLCYWLLVV